MSRMSAARRSRTAAVAVEVEVGPQEASSRLGKSQNKLGRWLKDKVVLCNSLRFGRATQQRSSTKDVSQRS